MTKIAINRCYGGFGLSLAATEFMAETGSREAKEYLRDMYITFGESEWHDFMPDNRADALLIQAIEMLGDTANGRCSALAIVEIPDDVEWEIDEYDGIEHVAEKHRTWC